MDAVFTDIESWLGAIGVWAYVVAPLIMATVSILPIPAEAPAMANGMLFGPAAGTLVTWVGAMAGAWVSYEIARWCRSPLASRVTDEATIAKVERLVDNAGWWGLLVLRLIPVVAFTALNWASGLVGVPRGRFLWTTAIGILPGVVLFTSSGVGLAALWTRSPSFTIGLIAVITLGSVIWTVRHRKGEAAG